MLTVQQKEKIIEAKYKGLEWLYDNWPEAYRAGRETTDIRQCKSCGRDFIYAANPCCSVACMQYHFSILTAPREAWLAWFSQEQIDGATDGYLGVKDGFHCIIKDGLTDDELVEEVHKRGLNTTTENGIIQWRGSASHSTLKGGRYERGLEASS